MFSIIPCVFKGKPPPPPPAILPSLILFLSIPVAVQINYHKQAIPTPHDSSVMDSAYVQLKKGFFPPKSLFFTGSFQHLFPCSAVQHTALNFDSYCFVVQRNLTGATLMIAPSLPTSTALPPASPLLSQSLESRGALQHRRGATQPHMQ